MHSLDKTTAQANTETLFERPHATTTLIIPFLLPKDRDQRRVFSRARRVGKAQLWSNLTQNTLDLEFIKRFTRSELLSLWGIAQNQQVESQHYSTYELTSDAVAWIFDNRVVEFELSSLTGESKQKIKWAPKRTHVVITEHNVGLMSITGYWISHSSDCSQEQLHMLSQGVQELKRFVKSQPFTPHPQSREETSPQKLRLSRLTDDLLSEADLTDYSSFRRPKRPLKHDPVIFGIEQPLLFTTAHLSPEIAEDQAQLQTVAWRLRRGYQHEYIPPPQLQTVDHHLWPRGNQFVSIASEGVLLLNWEHPDSKASRDVKYHYEIFLRRQLFFYLHCLLEVEVIKNVNQRALDRLYQRPKSTEDENTLLSWREELKLLMDVMVNYNLAINIPVCSSLSDYQLFYQATRSALRVDELRDDLESGIKLLYEVYETELGRLEEQRAQDEKARHEDNQRKVNIAISALTPFVLITGLFGMNNFDASQFHKIQTDPNLFEAIFYSISIGRLLCVGITLSLIFHMILNKKYSISWILSVIVFLSCTVWSFLSG